MNRNEGIEKDNGTYELMKTPEIVIQDERGVRLLSVLLKIDNPEWGSSEAPLAKETTEYFRDNPLPNEITSIIEDLKSMTIDEETLYNLALTYRHPERAALVFELAQKYKPRVKNPQEVYKKFLILIELFDAHFSATPLDAKFADETEKDIVERERRISENIYRVENMISYFRPDSRTLDIRRVVFIPTSPLLRKNSGRAFRVFPGEEIIMSHIDNIDNQDHEFLHGIINPIVDKLSEILSSKQKEKISKFASETLKQDYGTGYYSLLCEELIRTYIDIYRKGEKVETYEEFVQKIAKIDGEQFTRGLKNSKSLRKRCEAFGIDSIEAFIGRSRDYFDKYKENQLRHLIYKLYVDYSERIKSEDINFEQFVLEVIPTII